jgi:uncharacterized protein
MILKCPRCGTKTDSTGNPSRPFCSERCKTVDLGNWIMGTYRIPETDADKDGHETSPPPKDPERE